MVIITGSYLTKIINHNTLQILIEFPRPLPWKLLIVAKELAVQNPIVIRNTWTLFKRPSENPISPRSI
jgi:hypothetical protein